MNKKCTIVSIVLIALMCGYVFPTSVKAWDSGNGVAPSTAWNEYGPNLSTLWIHAYTSYGAEVAGMEGGKSDFIDMTLLPSDYATMSGMKIGGQSEFNFSTVVSLGVEEIDWNTAFRPFNNTDYAKAVSDILQIDHVNFVNTWVGSYPNGGTPCGSPIPGDIAVNSNWPWYNYNTESIYTGGYSDALTKLYSSAIPVAKDLAPTPGVPGGYTAYTWNFTAPYPLDTATGHSYNPLAGPGLLAVAAPGLCDGFNYMGNGANTGLYILTRSEDIRSTIGPEVVKYLGANFTWWYINVAYPGYLSGPTSPYYTVVQDFISELPAGANPATAVPYITVQNIFGTMADFEYPVMIFYCYEMYTAGYSYGFTPDSFMEAFLTSDSPQAFGWNVYLKDDTCFVDPTYDTLETFMENATTIGNPLINPYSQPGTALYYAWEAQMELMGGLGGSKPPACFPEFDEVGYSPIPAADEHGISNTYSPISSGFGNWYSYLNMYDTANSPFYSTNAAQQGLRRGTLCYVNPISSYTVYDFAVFSDIYDSLTISNPYNLSQLVPYIATDWSVGTWTNTGNGTWVAPKTCSNITITMRMDDEWQDVPGPENRAPYTLDNDSALNNALTDRYMTPLDVAFTYAYASMGVGFTAFYTMEPWCMQIDHIVISSSYESAWKAANPLGAVGYPWANETYIEKLMGITPGTLAWPTWQYVTPPTNSYFNTTLFEKQLVQFSPTLGTDQVQIYSSLLIPWLIAYRALGYIILPMDIFSHLAEGPWPTKDIQGKHWVTPDVTTLDLEPWSYSGKGGADLEYGSSAWILVDDPAAFPATTFRLDAYVQGLTYGPGLVFGGAPTITTDHSYFLYTGSAVVVQAVPGTGTISTTTPSVDPGPTFSWSVTIKNTNSSAANIAYSWLLDLYDPDHNNIGHYTVAGGTDTIAANGGTVTESGSYGPVAHFADPVLVAVTLQTTYLGRIRSSTFGQTFNYYQGQVGITGQKLVFQENYSAATPTAYNIQWKYSVHLYNASTGLFDTLLTTTTPVAPTAITSSNLTGTVWLVIGLGEFANMSSYLTWDEPLTVTFSFLYNGMTIDFGTTALNYHPGDIAGAAVTFPYLGADGVVNLYDLGVITGNWYASVPMTISPISPTAIADIAAVGVVNLFDLGYVTSNWYATWP